jgi:RND superfamily putative drug exporter
MDYEVFLLSRIREAYERSGDDRESVSRGLSESGGLITSAALIMVVLFGSFGFTTLTATREFGLGLAFAVALDATLIRVVLVPILMGLMGRANWWFPAFLRQRR